MSPSTHTHTYRTYLQYLRCSLTKPQHWRRSWIQQAAVNARPGTAVQARLCRVVTGHCCSIFPCVNPALSAFMTAPLLMSMHCFSHSWIQFGRKVDMLHHFLRQLEKSSRHCSPPIIFYRDSMMIY